MKKISFCLFLMFFSACTYAVERNKIDSPKTYTGSSTIHIPSSGLIISAPIHVSGKLKIKGHGPLTLNGAGRFVVDQNASLEIVGVPVLISDLDHEQGRRDEYIIQMDGGQLTLRNNNFIVDVPYSSGDSLTNAPWGESPAYWVVGLGTIAKKKHRQVKVEILDNNFENRNLYSAGAIKLSTRENGESLSLTELNSTYVAGKISANKFSGFHGAIFLYGGNGFNISGNFFEKNSYLSIIAGGKGVDILNNRILYPGNGATGDGITIHGIMVDGNVSGNLIYSGSCYGIWVLVNEAKNIKITDNTLVNGITSAIYLSKIKKNDDGAIDGVLIQGNIMTGNAGFAVAIEDGRDVTIVKNHFEGNAAGFPAQIFMSSSAHGVVAKGNTSAKKLTPEWSKNIALYRHQTYEDNNIFSPERKD